VLALASPGRIGVGSACGALGWAGAPPPPLAQVSSSPGPHLRPVLLGHRSGGSCGRVAAAAARPGSRAAPPVARVVGDRNAAWARCA
jgi:hypothetical protein